MKMTVLSDEALEDIANMLKGLSEKSRLKIMQSLHDGEKTVSSIVKETGYQQANISKHLSMLHKAGLVKSRREGNNVFYRITNPSVNKICESICDSYAKLISRKYKSLA